MRVHASCEYEGLQNDVRMRVVEQPRILGIMKMMFNARSVSFGYKIKLLG